MPWHQEPKKDVTSCDKPWGSAHTLDPGIPNGNPAEQYSRHPALNKIGVGRGTA